MVLSLLHLIARGFKGLFSHYLMILRLCSQVCKTILSRFPNSVIQEFQVSRILRFTHLLILWSYVVFNSVSLRMNVDLFDPEIQSSQVAKILISVAGAGLAFRPETPLWLGWLFSAWTIRLSGACAWPVINRVCCPPCLYAEML